MEGTRLLMDTQDGRAWSPLLPFVVPSCTCVHLFSSLTKTTQWVKSIRHSNPLCHWQSISIVSSQMSCEIETFLFNIYHDIYIILESEPKNILHKCTLIQAWQVPYLLYIIKKHSGFFVEAGAFEGAIDSTTLHFELAHQWSGLLIEPVAG